MLSSDFETRSSLWVKNELSTLENSFCTESEDRITHFGPKVRTGVLNAAPTASLWYCTKKFPTLLSIYGARRHNQK